jgi:hypothetical protein
VVPYRKNSNDGIHLKNINSKELDIIMDYMYSMSDGLDKKQVILPTKLLDLMAFLGPCEFLGLEGLKKLVILELLRNEQFLKYTNVRRHVIDNLNDKEIEFVLISIQIIISIWYRCMKICAQT